MARCMPEACALVLQIAHRVCTHGIHTGYGHRVCTQGMHTRYAHRVWTQGIYTQGIYTGYKYTGIYTVYKYMRTQGRYTGIHIG